MNWTQRLLSDSRLSSTVVHIESLPARPAEYAQPRQPLPDVLRRVLKNRGIGQLYTHQVRALELARSGQDLVVVTGTASGKTLCYNIPVLEACLCDPQCSALYVFPTKALCQDQLGTLQELLFGQARLQAAARPAIYDGDTPQADRRRIRSNANLLLTNPDMLHVGILPYHAKWSRLLAGLRFIVLDEVHTYRGIFGANVAGVLRRLLRLCDHYGAEPVCLAASATVANPGELVQRLIGRPVQVVDRDGSPRGPRYFLLVNPPHVGQDRSTRRSASDQAARLMSRLVAAGAQTIAFSRTRQGTELVYRTVRRMLGRRRPELAGQVRAYRGGYLPRQRRAIERRLFSGQLKGVVSTSALELGIDVGSLDAAILIGYPGTIASTWQQAGRAGRRAEPSLAVLVARNDPVDQYLLRHAEYLFGKSPEHAVVDPENPYILQNHLQAAAFELPLTEADQDRFGPLTRPIAEALHEAKMLNEVGGRFYATAPRTPAVQFSLRHMSNNTFAIIERVGSEPGQPNCLNGFRLPGGGTGPAASHRPALTPQIPSGFRAIANVDAISAPELVYPQAVYLHNGDSYVVRKLDLESKLAYVERVETDYYTQAILDSSVRVRQPREWKPVEAKHSGRALAADSEPEQRPSLPHPCLTLTFFGDLDVSWKTVGFKKIRFETRENLGVGPVELPAQSLPTTGFWLVPSAQVLQQLRRQGLQPYEGLVGLRNLFVQALPLLAMCDPPDISGVVNASNLGTPAVFVYDRYPGGLGYSEKGYALIQRLLAVCLQMVSECPCQDGCPSCVGLPNLRPAIHSDPDLLAGYPMPDKRAAQALVLAMQAQPAPVSSA